jgi:predicted MPP superfamily phosphohydrolase
MLFRLHFFPGFLILVLGLGLVCQLYWQLRNRPARAAAILGPVAALLLFGYLLEFHRVYRYFPVNFATWVQGAAVGAAMCLIGFAIGVAVYRSAPVSQSKRRTFLKAAGAGLCVAPAAAVAFGIVVRNRFRVVEVKVPIPNLPKDLDGLKIVQITDIHLSTFLSEHEFARAVDMANETRAHVALVTGDLISRPGDPLDACLKQLARIRAEAGVLGCLGNHEVYTKTEDYVTARGRDIGIEFLRSATRQLRFGNAAINFAGVDYQNSHDGYLHGAERLIVPGAVNILLSHNPDVFPVAAAQGYQLTIAGHTHGGQVDVEILHRHMNVARYFTRYVRGLYGEGPSSIYVSSGLGTIGVPVRLGAPPEVTLLQLCAT